MSNFWGPVQRQLDQGQIRPRQAAEQLQLSVRQTKRWLKVYRHQSVQGLVSKKRGRLSNHQLDSATQQRALELIQIRYANFGPTLAHEKLTQVHHLKLARETVRGLMIGSRLWRPR